MHQSYSKIHLFYHLSFNSTYLFTYRGLSTGGGGGALYFFLNAIVHVSGSEISDNYGYQGGGMLPSYFSFSFFTFSFSFLFCCLFVLLIAAT